MTRTHHHLLDPASGEISAPYDLEAAGLQAPKMALECEGCSELTEVVQRLIKPGDLVECRTCGISIEVVDLRGGRIEVDLGEGEG